ncbi:MAG: hypothetical protein H0T46_12425 [Deltaproteobacteria bacterium]|nr:hypothetical protein [Deltaproteobacteria bacterium]
MTLEEALAAPGRKVQISGKELRPDGRALLIYSVGDDGAKQLARTRLPEAEHEAKVAELKAQGVGIAETDFKSGVFWVRTDDGVEVYDDKRKLFEAAGEQATLAGGKVLSRADVALVFSYAEGYEDRGVKAALASGEQIDLAYAFDLSAEEDPTYNRNNLISDTTWCSAVGQAIARWAGVPFENRI